MNLVTTSISATAPWFRAAKRSSAPPIVWDDRDWQFLSLVWTKQFAPGTTVPVVEKRGYKFGSGTHVEAIMDAYWCSISSFGLSLVIPTFLIVLLAIQHDAIAMQGFRNGPKLHHIGTVHLNGCG